MSVPPSQIYEFGNYRLDSAKRLLWRDGATVSLTPRVFDTLLYMIEHPDTVLDKERIMEAVWPDSVVEENNLTQNISTLRRVFGETPGSHRYIVTVPGRGYRFVGGVHAGATPVRDQASASNPVQELADAVPGNGSARHGDTRKQRFPTRRAFLLAGALILAGGFAFGIHKGSIPEKTVRTKSIAVLPFESLSANPENGYLASGIQDEILSNLAKISNLKVISRTSANLYKASSPRNAREIGEQLGVTHLLEGSVQRSGEHLRVHAQLIETETDSHLWAQTYDRDLADIFAIQREIAQTIADQLQIKIAEQEQASIAEPLTRDLLANQLYAEARALEFQEPEKENHLKAISLLDQATARDPQFVMAYCLLAKINLAIYLSGRDLNASRMQMVNDALQKATDLRPNSGEVHLARAFYYAFGSSDYNRARAELDFAQRTLPNSAAVYHYTALIDRRQGRWSEALRNFERALELDPRNVEVISDTASTYEGVHRYSDAARYCRRLLAIEPHNYWGRLLLPQIRWYEFGDIQPYRAELRAILSDEPDAAPKILDELFECAVLERDPAALDRVLAMIPPEGLGTLPGLVLPHVWFEGYAARVSKRPEKARPALEKALEILRKLVSEQPDNALAWSSLGLTQALLDHKAEAIQSGLKACEILPESEEATSGRRPAKFLTKIYAIVGEKDLALDRLTQSILQPMGEGYGELKLCPEWDLLRDDPRFETLLASVAPTENNTR